MKNIINTRDMNKNNFFVTFLLVFFSLTILLSCTKENSTEEEIDNSDVEVNIDNNENSDNNEGSDGNENSDNNENSDLLERYVFEGNIVIENSYNTSGCENPPCNTIDESLANVFVNDVPDDPYFYLSEDQSELILACQFEEGRRIEFKQRSEGSLNSFSKIELEGVYYDVPSSGITIAQVHNRGGNSNKPFFRLVLFQDGLETVIRKEPEVSSRDTSFSKVTYPFLENESYNLFNLTTTLEKSDGFVHIQVAQDGVLILQASFEPDPTTKWVTDNGILNGFYLKAGIYNDDGDHNKNIMAGFSSVKFETDDL